MQRRPVQATALKSDSRIKSRQDRLKAEDSLTTSLDEALPRAFHDMISLLKQF